MRTITAIICIIGLFLLGYWMVHVIDFVIAMCSGGSTLQFIAFVLLIIAIILLWKDEDNV